MAVAIFGLRLGRRRCILVGCVFVVIGGAVQSAVYSLAQMIVFRVIAGIGTGMISSTVPVWISEIFGPTKRGQKTAIQLTLVLTGNVTAYWLEYGMEGLKTSTSCPLKLHLLASDYFSLGVTQLSGDIAFRFPIAFQCIFPIIAFSITLLLPESPRILYLWDNIEEADEVLARLHDVDGPPESDPVTAFEKQQILQNIHMERSLKLESSMTWRNALWDNSPIRNSRRLAIVVVLQGLQQLGNRFTNNCEMPF